MRAQVCGGETDLLSEAIAPRHRSQNRIFTTKHRCCSCEIAFLDRLANRGAADDFAIRFHGRHADNFEMELRAEFLEKLEIPTAISSERPFMSNANFS